MFLKGRTGPKGVVTSGILLLLGPAMVLRPQARRLGLKACVTSIELDKEILGISKESFGNSSGILRELRNPQGIPRGFLGK